MTSTRISTLEGAREKVGPLLQPLPGSGGGSSSSAAAAAAAHGAVQMRVRSSQSSADRLSQSKSMVLQDSDCSQKQISRHRRNQSQHQSGAATLQPVLQLQGEHLNVTKISVDGKKQRKNWATMWTLLTADELHFHKDKQDGSSGATPAARTDVIQLCGAHVEWTTDKSSKKNVFQVTTATGSEYLIQTDTYFTASKWYNAIRRNMDSSTKENKAKLRRSTSTEYLPRHNSLKASGSGSSTSPGTKPRNQTNRRSINMFGSSKLKHSASDSADKNGVKNRLRKFISRRPSMKTLQEKGLIKERVFGCHLLTLCKREGTTVPKFVQICLDTVEKRGLDVDGIYRVSGNLATIQKLRFIVDQEEELDLDHSQWEDIHVVTGAVKMFFRELPEPLFPFSSFEPFVEAVRIKDSQEKLQAMKKLIQQLPRPNRDTMKLLFTHLLRVLAQSRKNLMSTQGIGIVFGPTLMWPRQEAGNMALNMLYQNQIIEFILIQSQDIFS